MSLFAEFHWMQRRIVELDYELQALAHLPNHERALVGDDGKILVTGTPGEIAEWLRETEAAS